MRQALLLLLIGISFLGVGSAVAMNAGGHGAAGAHVDQELGEAGREYLKAMDDMHGSMMEGIRDPNPDAAFVKGMLPHHKGAVAMANIELKYGTDPALRKLAQDIIDAQEKEIEFMEQWLEKRSVAQGRNGRIAQAGVPGGRMVQLTSRPSLPR